MLLLAQIVAANLLAGVGSVLLAARLTQGMQSRLIGPMVGFSTGMMLGTALLNLIPEVVEQGMDIHGVTRMLLAGFMLMFLLEKALLLRHDHHHEGDGHDHHHGHDRHAAGPGGALVLIGDSIHGFGDGVVVAAAFLADVHVGWATAIAVALHEIPQEIGDFIVLRNAGFTRGRALFFNALAGMATVLGGVVGYLMLQQAQQLVPPAVALSASTLMYIALADLVPGLHRQPKLRTSVEQIVLMIAGIGAASVAAQFAHGH